MRDLHPRHRGQHRQPEVRGGAVAGRSEIELPWLRTRQRQQLGHAVGRVRRRHHQQHRRGGDQADRLEGALDVEWQVAIQKAVDHLGAGIADHQRMAVGSRLGDVLHRDGAVGAGAVFHHHRLAPQGFQAYRHQARQNVGDAAGGVRHDDADRRTRIILGRRRRRHQHGRNNDPPQPSALHGFFSNPDTVWSGAPDTCTVL